MERGERRRRRRRDLRGVSNWIKMPGSGFDNSTTVGDKKKDLKYSIPDGQYNILNPI